MVKEHKEVVELCKQHLEEVENLEKRKHIEKTQGERIDLLGNAGGDMYIDTKGRGGRDIIT
jgi:hypothetical protein